METWSLGKEFRGNRALDGIDLAVPGGSVFALVGPGGAGKSTLLKIIMGLLEPSTGGGLCLGLDIRTRGEQIRQRTGYIAEAPSYYGYMTVERLLKFCRGFYPRWDDGLAGRLLERFELPARVKVRGLSRGARHLLGLVAALAPRPELLLLDEPAAALEPALLRLFFDAVNREAVSRGCTVLLTGRRFDEPAQLAGRVALIERGRLARIRSVKGGMASGPADPLQ